MGVTVYLKSGHSAELPTATNVRRDTMSAEGGGQYPAVICYDSQDREVGCFLLGEIAGWATGPATGGRSSRARRGSDAARRAEVLEGAADAAKSP